RGILRTFFAECCKCCGARHRRYKTKFFLRLFRRNRPRIAEVIQDVGASCKPSQSSWNGQAMASSDANSSMQRRHVLRSNVEDTCCLPLKGAGNRVSQVVQAEKLHGRIMSWQRVDQPRGQHSTKKCS